MENEVKTINDLKYKFFELKDFFKFELKFKKLESLRLLMTDPEFWNKQEEAIKISQEAEDLSSELKLWQEIEKDLLELDEIIKLVEFDNDLSLSKELSEKINDLNASISDLEFKILFSKEYDKSNAFISIHAGVGGVDAQDWAEMLERMFLRFCERKGFKVKILDLNYGNEAGLKSAEIKISGPYAYGYLKSENGVHRLLRNSPFNADNLRQTSFALVEVVPEIKEKDSFEIKEDDLRIDVFRSSGPGGQSVNTTDSAVRITYLPSNIVVSCQSERSQHQNKENALNILRNKLIKINLEKREALEKSLKGDSKADWGRQIRSYFLYGNRLVKDHRSGFETSNVDSVLDGDLEGFIQSYLRIKK